MRRQDLADDRVGYIGSRQVSWVKLADCGRSGAEKNARPGNAGAGVFSDQTARLIDCQYYWPTTVEQPAVVRIVIVQPAGHACATVCPLASGPF